LRLGQGIVSRKLNDMNMKLKEFAKYLEATSDPAHSRVKELMEPKENGFLSKKPG